MVIRLVPRPRRSDHKGTCGRDRGFIYRRRVKTKRFSAEAFVARSGLAGADAAEREAVNRHLGRGREASESTKKLLSVNLERSGASENRL